MEKSVAGKKHGRENDSRHSGETTGKDLGSKRDWQEDVDAKRRLDSGGFRCMLQWERVK